MRKINYNFLECAKCMPPLPHSFENSFDINKSEVVQWLMSQPSIMQKVFTMAINRKLILYDRETKKWIGVDYKKC